MTENLKEQLLELYSKNLLDTQIAKIIGKSPDSVAIYRKKLNLQNNKLKHLQNIENDIIKSLLNKETVYSITKKFNCSSTYVRNLSLINNIETLKFKDMVLDRRKVNHNPFEDLNNSNVQYWLGFLAADGAIFESKISLGLQEIDEKHIDKFIDFIGADLTKTKSIKDNKYVLYSTSFRNRDVTKFLNNLGITSNKSKTISYEYFTNDFLRGVMDGDGYIRKNHTSASITTASEIFAKQIQQFIITTYKVNSTIYMTQQKYFVVGVHGRNQVELFLNKLYNNADTYLERKYINAMLYRNI